MDDRIDWYDSGNDWTATVDRILVDNCRSRSTSGDLPRIMELAAKLAGVTVSDMAGRCRHFAATEARRIYVGAARALTVCSLPEIAETIKRPRHTAAIHQMRAFNKWPKEKRDAIVEVIRKELECPTK